MPRRRRRQLTSVARSVMSTSSQRRFGRTSAAAAAARTAGATQTLNPTANRRLVRYRQPRQAGNSRYEVRSRRNQGIAVARYVGMAH